MEFYELFDQLKRLICMPLQWKQLRDLQSSKSTKFRLVFSRHDSIEEILGRVNKEMRSIRDSRATTRGSWCVFVVVVRATKRKILHVLRMEELAITVESKGILVESAKERNKRLKTRSLALLRNNELEFGMWQPNMTPLTMSICLLLGATNRRKKLFR